LIESNPAIKKISTIVKQVNDKFALYKIMLNKTVKMRDDDISQLQKRVINLEYHLNMSRHREQQRMRRLKRRAIARKERLQRRREGRMI
jgi:hypothetical protein